MTQTSETFEAALARFLAAAQVNLASHYATNYPNLVKIGQVDHLEAMEGVKYVRIVRTDGIGRSAYCFIEKSTGNVLKCDGYKRPAKGVRGSIYSQTFEGYGVTVYGAVYAR